MLSKRERAVLFWMKVQLSNTSSYLHNHYRHTSEDMRLEIDFLDRQIAVVQELLDGRYAEDE